MRSLEDTLAYRHDGVVDKLQTVYGIDAKEADDLFLEAKRWLWLQARASRDRAAGQRAPRYLPITPSLTMIDEAWHTFILFTRDYLTFCADFLGEIVHHLPNAGQYADHTSDLTPVLEDMMYYVYETLGRDVLIKWYAEYQDKYAGVEVRFVATPRPQPAASVAARL